jgi:hypothetical protein
MEAWPGAMDRCHGVSIHDVSEKHRCSYHTQMHKIKKLMNYKSNWIEFFMNWVIPMVELAEDVYHRQREFITKLDD